MSAHDPLPISEIRECLERSGYFMESRLVHGLTAADFFVEPSVAHRDPRTGKAREIDLTAEGAPTARTPGIAVKTTLVVEAVNNRFPIVLLTQREWTPNTDSESYVKYAESPDPAPFIGIVNVFEEKGANCDSLYSQYCALTRKSGKDDLMASHSEDTYSSLLKLAEYTEAELAAFREWTADEQDKHWRLFFWQPMLVLGGPLMTATLGPNGDLVLQEVPLARLEFNWHDGEWRKTTVVEFVREDHFLDRARAIRAQDSDIAQRIQAYRQSGLLPVSKTLC